MYSLHKTLQETLLLIGVLTAINVTMAQELKQESLSLNECKELILENNEDAIIASAEIEAREQEIKVSKTRFLPSVSASSTGSGFTDNPVLTSFARYSVVGDISLEQPLYNGGKLKALLNLAKVQKEISQNKKKLTDEQLLYYVEQLYWQVVATRQQVIVAEEYLKTLSDLETKIDNYFKAGIVNKTDLLETQVEKNRAQYNVEVATNARYLSKLQLAYAIGKENTDFTIDDSFTSPVVSYNYSADKETSFLLRPELHVLMNSLKAKTEEEKLIKSDYRPQLNLSLGGYYYIGEETDPRAIETDQGFGAAFVSLEIPIFNWGQKKHRLKRNKIEAEQIEFNQQKTKKRISIEVQQAIDKIDESTINVALSEKSKTQAQENARIINENYNAGTITSEEVLEAEALYQESQLEYINARVQEQLSYSNYLRTLGKLSN